MVEVMPGLRPGTSHQIADLFPQRNRASCPTFASTDRRKARGIVQNVHSIMAQQYGLVSRSQAIDSGLTRHHIDGYLRRDEWVVVERSVYQHVAVSPSWRSNLLAACLTSGGLASHRCAAALWEIAGYNQPKIEIVLPNPSGYRNDSHLVHSTSQWDRVDKVRRAGIPCTGIARTILDLGAVASLRRLEMAAESALRQQLLEWPDLRACLIRHSRRGRTGCGRLRVLLEARHGDEPLPLSAWSNLVRDIIMDAGLPRPELEWNVLDNNARIITSLDLAWPDRLLALELDSVRWHLNRKSFEKDRRKRNRARLAGWVIHELTWSMSIGDRTALVSFVESALESRSVVV